MQAVLDPVQTEPASFPLDLPPRSSTPISSSPRPSPAPLTPFLPSGRHPLEGELVRLRVLEAEARIARRAELRRRAA